MRTLSMIAVFLFGTMSLLAQTSADDVLGVWLNEDEDAHIQITRDGDQFIGKIVWLKNPIDDETSNPRLDKNNPDENLAKEPLMGLKLLKDFVYDAEDEEWEDGEIYDPKNGNTYSCYMKFTEEGKDKLKIRGFIGVTWLGRTTYWTRVSK